MSAGRKHRRAVARQRAASALRAADQAPAVYEGDVAGGAIWRRGGVLFVLPRALPGMLAALVAAIELRNTASLTGEWPGVRAVATSASGPATSARRRSGTRHAGGEVDELARRHWWEPA